MKADQFPGLADRIDHAMMPEGPMGRFHRHGHLENAILKSSPNREAAKDFIRWIMKPDHYGGWLEAQQGYSLGSGQRWGSLEMWGRDPRLAIFRDSAKFERLHGWPGPCNRAAGEVFAKHILVDMFAKAVNGNETPRTPWRGPSRSLSTCTRRPDPPHWSPPAYGGAVRVRLESAGAATETPSEPNDRRNGD